MSDTPTEALEKLRDSIKAKSDGQFERLYDCGVCLDTGWEELDTKGHGLVRRCRRGCDTQRHKAYVESLSAEVRVGAHGGTQK